MIANHWFGASLDQHFTELTHMNPGSHLLCFLPGLSDNVGHFCGQYFVKAACHGYLKKTLVGLGPEKVILR
ncbi:hypothetical protein ACLH0O_20545 [Aeromonas media]